MTHKTYPSSRHGFTLTEVMVTLPLVALLFGGTITLFLQSQRLVQRTSVATQSTQDAAVGVQYISTTAREAIHFSLPPDTTATNTNGLTFLPPDGNLSHYQNGNINTAVEILLPAASAGFNVLDRNGHAVSPGGCDRTQPEITGGMPADPLLGDLLCVYRGDTLGNPSPSTGQCLWSITRPAGRGLYDPSHDIRRRICRLVLTAHADGSSATDSVQFIGSTTPGTDIPSAMPYELEFKLACGDGTAIGGAQTNENGDSKSSILVGKCVLMRNHN